MTDPLKKQHYHSLIAKNSSTSLARRTQIIEEDSIQLLFSLYSRNGSSDFVFRGDYLAGVVDSNGDLHSKAPVLHHWREIAPGVRAKRKKTNDEEITIVEVTRDACPLSLVIKTVAGYRSPKSGLIEDTWEESYIDFQRSDASSSPPDLEASCDTAEEVSGSDGTSSLPGSSSSSSSSSD